MTVKPSGFAFDVAVSSTDSDARVLRELERQMLLRLPSIPPQRPVWTSAAAELLDAPRVSVFTKSARVVVILHQHHWGKDETTKADAAAIKRRVTANGADSVRVVLLDHSELPAWLRKSPAKLLGDGAECAEWIIEGVAALGGVTRRAEDAAGSLADGDRSTQQRDTFLASHRAITHLGREFDRLAAEVAKRAATVKTVNRDEVEVPLEVHRVPGRCTVQLGPVALTLSWIRTRPDTVATGRLMIIEWEGQIGRGGAAGGPSPIPLRETVLRADATRVEDWQWTSDEVAGFAYDSTELAAHCVDSLAYALQDRGR